VHILLAIVVGVLYAVSFYLIMRPSMVRLIMGLSLLSHGANLLLFTIGRVTRSQIPIVSKGSEVPVESFANPLPQALILTAIVISFGVLGFTMALFYKFYQTEHTDNVNTAGGTDL
jgi:multicomponent Na+:H+ antiporter subunit C